MIMLWQHTLSTAVFILAKRGGCPDNPFAGTNELPLMQFHTEEIANTDMQALFISDTIKLSDMLADINKNIVIFAPENKNRNI